MVLTVADLIQIGVINSLVSLNSGLLQRVLSITSSFVAASLTCFWRHHRFFVLSLALNSGASL